MRLHIKRRKASFSISCEETNRTASFIRLLVLFVVTKTPLQFLSFLVKVFVAFVLLFYQKTTI